MTRAQGLEKRLKGYWKLEAWNVLLVPLGTYFIAWGEIGWLTAITFVPVCLLLAIGAYYWRTKLRYLQHQEPLQPRISACARWQLPSAILAITGVLVAAAGWIWPGLSVGLIDRIAATSMAVLAVLEYVNYYHRQLQHFDRQADWERLVQGRGFRTSQLRKDMERFGLR